MDEALDRAFHVVADRVVRLGRVAQELAPVGHELAGDRVGRLPFVDEACQRRSEADRIPVGDRLELGQPLRRDEAGFDELFGRRQAARFEKEVQGLRAVHVGDVFINHVRAVRPSGAPAFRLPT